MANPQPKPTSAQRVAKHRANQRAAQARALLPLNLVPGLLEAAAQHIEQAAEVLRAHDQHDDATELEETARKLRADFA